MASLIHLFAIGMFAFLCLSPFSAEAHAKQCDLFSNFISLRTSSFEQFDGYYNFNYERFRKILFLSDGGIGGKYAKRSNSSQLFVSTDLEINRNIDELAGFEGGVGVSIRVDNNNLPFKENTFDLIVMNRGLCLCKGAGQACGGIDTHHESMRKFLQGAINILDKHHDNALALFTGYYFPALAQSEIPTLWRAILNDLKVQFPQLQFAFLYDERKKLTGDQAFIGIAVATGSQPIAETLNQLKAKLAPDSH